MTTVHSLLRIFWLVIVLVALTVSILMLIAHRDQEATDWALTAGVALALRTTFIHDEELRTLRRHQRNIEAELAQRD
jgi:hypothetical protein